MRCQLAVVALPPGATVARVKAVPNLWGLAFLGGRDSGKRSSFNVSIRLILAVLRMLKSRADMLEIFNKHIGMNNTVLDNVSSRGSS